MLDGLEYLRTATLGLPYPGHAGKRVVVIGGGFTSMDCTRTSVRQGASRGDPRLPPRHEGHAGLERGPRGDRGRRARRSSRPRPTRVIVDADGQGHRRRVHPHASSARPDASGRRRPEPAPGTEFTIACDRVLLAIGQGPDLTWIGPGSDGLAGHQAAPAQGRRGHLRDRPARASSAPATSGSARRPSSRPSPRAAAAPTPSTPSSRASTWARSRPARRWPSRSPSSSRSCPSRARSRSRATGSRRWTAEVRNKSYVEYEIPYTPAEAVAESHPLPAVHLRGDRLLRPAPARASSTARRCRRSSRGYHQGAGFRSVTENRFTGAQPRLHPRRQPRLHPARAVALHRLRPLRQRLLGGRRRGLLRLHADRLRHAGHDAARHEPQRHAVRVAAAAAPRRARPAP